MALHNELNYTGQLHFLTSTFDETFAESKLQSKYLLKSKSEVISLSRNPLRLLTLAERKHGDYVQFYMDKRRNGYIMT